MNGGRVGRCSCVWEPFGEHPGRIMARRTETCEVHGDGTPWWERTQRHAAALGARHHAIEPGPAGAPDSSGSDEANLGFGERTV